MAPRQLSHQWCDFLVMPVRFVELPHPEEIRSRESLQAGLLPLNVASQLLDHTLTPICDFNLPCNVCAHPPVEIHEPGVDGGQRPSARGLDHLDDFRKALCIEGGRLGVLAVQPRPPHRGPSA